MSENQASNTLLGPYRVLDLTDEKGALCGKILGDLGTDVIKIERPGGDPSRNIGPFYHDIPDPEKSLNWFAYNANKRGITLNLETLDGQHIFKKLVKKADIVVESFPPGFMEKLGLGYSALSGINVKIIMTSITAFGQSGPYKDFKASDIVIMALGGPMYLYGDPDRAPIRISVDQAYFHASADAAIGTLAALYYREVSGEGQYLDVSAQESVLWAISEALSWWPVNKFRVKRLGAFWQGMSQMKMKNRTTWPCKDGYINFDLFGGVVGERFNRQLTEWMDSEGMADEFLRNVDWASFDYATTSEETVRRYEDYFSKFFMGHTKKELFDGALKRAIALYPVNDTKDIAEDEQLKARDFWQEVEHPELGITITYLGAFIKSTETSCGVRRRAPLIGEHNREIYVGELNLSEEELSILKYTGVI